MLGDLLVALVAFSGGNFSVTFADDVVLSGASVASNSMDSWFL
jgi:hypothetical protein